MLAAVTLLLILCAGARAEEAIAENQAPPVRILKGELIEWKIQGLAGEMALRDEESRVERCRVYPKSHLMRSNIRIHPHGVRLGDMVEVVADFRAGAARCAVVTLYIQHFTPRRKMVDGKLRSPVYPSSYLNNLWARGLLTFTGIVSRVEDGTLLIRTRNDGERTFTLRDDTVFQNLGRQVQRETLESWTRVFVRASRMYDGTLEAHQVVWGGILTPDR
jgi:hypothetical protein